MFFTRNNKKAVSTFVLKLVNNQCPELLSLQDGPRNDTRVNLSMVVLVIPMEKKKPMIAKAFHATTKDFSTTSVGLIVDAPRAIENAILVFRREGEMFFALSNAKHLTPMGGGFFQLGFEMEEMISPADYPELAKLNFY